MSALVRETWSKSERQEPVWRLKGGTDQANSLIKTNKLLCRVKVYQPNSALNNVFHRWRPRTKPVA